MKFSALQINLGAPEVKLYVLVSKLGDLGASLDYRSQAKHLRNQVGLLIAMFGVLGANSGAIGARFMALGANQRGFGSQVCGTEIQFGGSGS